MPGTDFSTSSSGSDQPVAEAEGVRPLQFAGDERGRDYSPSNASDTPLADRRLKIIPLLGQSRSCCVPSYWSAIQSDDSASNCFGEIQDVLRAGPFEGWIALGLSPYGLAIMTSCRSTSKRWR